mgnify:FL=1|tara:strand:+ start:2517 stop:2897 length:381 start_codon:yes stop_codon:yes gene_type:complete
MHYYFPGMAVGLILMQTAIVAPSLFRSLEIDVFGKAIRDLWPKFFLALITIGILTTISLYFYEGATNIQYSISISTIILASVCYLIIPATNKATDDGNQKIFGILHRISVSFTVIMLISNIAFLVT